MNAKTQTFYDYWREGRAKRVLREGQRWLTTDDVWQEGDEYNGHANDWWAIGGPFTSIPAGTPVCIGMLCYTPRGSIKRA